MSEDDDPVKAPSANDGPKTGHPVFLILAAFSVVGLLATYNYEDALIGGFSGSLGSSSASLVFAVSLILLVLLTLFFVMCYRTPRLSDRILGKAKVLPDDETSGFKYTGGGFTPASAGDEKKLNSQRKSARAMRKQLAAKQRELDAKDNPSSDTED